MPALPPRLLLALVSALIVSAPALAQTSTLAPAPTPAAPAPAAATAPPAPVKMPPKMTQTEYRMGNPKAKVTLIEYASDTCPHCAKFAAETFPAFKAKYVDTGKVLYVFREFPTDPVQVSAAGFVIARCAGYDKYFDVITTLFQSQRLGSARDFLLAGAKAGGLDEEQVKTCLDDPTAGPDLKARVDNAINVEKVDSTPTLILNGKKLDNTTEKTIKDLDAAIEPLLTPTKAKVAPKHRKA